ncbi:MAG: PIG-L family deacetylase [Alphaproteobacteria bacterium]
MEKLSNQHQSPSRFAQAYRLITIASSPLKLLQTGAHPDDESSHLLSLFAQKFGFQVIYVCATRGEGGQNDVSDDYGANLALIRSQEMLGAAQKIPMEQYWVNHNPNDPIRDFGFSASGSETLERWGGIEALTDAFVYHIRLHQPDLLCPTFLDVEGQHGHHKAVTRATIAAFDKAADANYICKADPKLAPWQCAKLLLPAWSGGGSAYDDSTPPPVAHHEFLLNEIESLSGQSYLQQGEISRQNHQSQSMGYWLSEGTQDISFFGGAKVGLHILDAKIGSQTDLFDGLAQNFKELALLYAPEYIEAFEKIDDDLTNIKTELANPTACRHSIWNLQQYIKELTPSQPYAQTRLQQLERHLTRLLQIYSQIYVRLEWEKPYIIAGQRNKGKIRIFNGNSQAITLTAISDNPFFSPYAQSITIEAMSEYILPVDWQPQPPSDMNTQFFMGSNGIYGLSPYKNLPEIQFDFSIGGMEISLPYTAFEDPIIHPSLYLDEPINLRMNNQTIELSLNVLAMEQQGQLNIQSADGQMIFAKDYQLSQGINRVEITPPQWAEGQHQIYWNDMPLQVIKEIDLNHLKQKIYSITPAVIKQLNLQNKRNISTKIAFIYHNSLALCRITQNLAEYLDIYTSDNLYQLIPDDYDIIILDSCIRASYGAMIDDIMPSINQWVHRGGRLISLYQRPQDDPQNQMAWVGDFTIGSPSIRWRETDADAPIFMHDDLLFSAPNPITDADWQNWAQERGLYFVSAYQPPYQSAITIQKGNNRFDGSLIMGQFGQGQHIHCSLAIERQMRISHKGAIRLWQNILWE